MKDIVIDGEREILTEVGMGACKGQNIIAIQFHLLSSNRSCETNNMEGERENKRAHVHHPLQSKDYHRTYQKFFMHSSCQSKTEWSL